MGAVTIATHFKHLILGLEPEEIAQLLVEKEAILQSIHEGIIAIKKDGRIKLINSAAKELIDPPETAPDIVGQHVADVIPNTKLLDVLETGKRQFNHEMVLGRHVVIVNRVPIFFENQVVGVVASFRNKSEIDHLTQELTKIKQYAEALRAQTHEFANKLYTISGLLQLNQISEAIQFINKENKLQQDWIQFLIHHVSDPLISAVLLGSLNKANELGIEMEIDPESSLSYMFKEEEKEHLITIIGNLIQNSLEAALQNKAVKPRLRVFLTDLGSEIIFEVEDSGSGDCA